MIYVVLSPSSDSSPSSLLCISHTVCLLSTTFIYHIHFKQLHEKILWSKLETFISSFSMPLLLVAMIWLQQVEKLNSSSHQPCWFCSSGFGARSNNCFKIRSHAYITSLSWLKGMRVLGIPDSITKKMSKVARSQGRRN